MDAKLVGQVRHWMFDEALPFWADQGLDRVHGGVIESLALNGREPSSANFKRARVACRQVYVFSHAELLGWAGARQAADHVYAHFVERFWQGDDAGWARRVTREGAVLDATPDLYDYAFALFALGWRHKATGDSQALALAHKTLDLLEARFRHPSGAGFHAALPAALPREQNPHMHLTEAALVLAETSGEACFRALADETAALFRSRICRIADGVLPEFFDDDWKPLEGDRGKLTEPGHQFEWAWILAQHQKLTGADNAAAIAALVQRSERFGVDANTGVTYNSVHESGAPIDRGSRTWPNTERIKGWLGHYEVNGADPRAAVAGSVAVLFERYFVHAPKACWIDAFDADGKPSVETIPTSTLYHVFLAFAEVLRLAPDLSGTDSV